MPRSAHALAARSQHQTNVPRTLMRGKRYTQQGGGGGSRQQNLQQARIVYKHAHHVLIDMLNSGWGGPIDSNVGALRGRGNEGAKKVFLVRDGGDSARTATPSISLITAFTMTAADAVVVKTTTAAATKITKGSKQVQAVKVVMLGSRHYDRGRDACQGARTRSHCVRNTATRCSAATLRSFSRTNQITRAM